MKNIIFATFLLSTIFLLTACGKEKVIFEKEYPIQNSAWTYADTLSFAFNIADTTALYDIVVHIKHRSDYGFQNLYTRIHTTFPTGERRSQVLNFDLADNTGKWIGEKNGDYRDFVVKIQDNAFFNKIGQHVITLEQLMRKESLVGFKSIGLEVIEKEEKRKDKKVKSGKSEK